jgi:predicted dehydrogenase
MPHADRRDFLKSAAALTAAGAAAAISPVVFGQDQPTGERVVVGMMGTAGRGTAVAGTFAGLPNVVVKYVADVDEAHAAAAAKSVGAKARAANENTPPPTPVKDFRRLLDDPEVTVLAIAAPDHWHAPAAILAAAAGKHVYVEKPCSHNPREGELLVAAQKKFNRVIQHGTQRRSWPKVIEAVRKVREGAIGKVRLARGWYNNNRPSIGRGKPAPVPKNLDWSLWQGPAPEREFRDNYVHYHWHWFTHWGTGECGNNGIHSLDVCRWGLGVDCPKKVVSAGGRYHFDDDWEFPDTQFVTFDYGDKAIHWEGRSCHPRGLEEKAAGFGVAFYGDQGTLILDGGGYKIFDPKNKEVSAETGPARDNEHLANFVEAIRANDPAKLNAPIHEGVASVLLCHLGNISQRTGRALGVDPATRQITGDAYAMKLWAREYRTGWEPKV